MISKDFFGGCLLLPAEVPHSVKQGRPPSLVVTAFLLTQLRALEQYIKEAVPQIRMMLQEGGGITSRNSPGHGEPMAVARPARRGRSFGRCMLVLWD